jgi:hypothetical protein
MKLGWRRRAERREMSRWVEESRREKEGRQVRGGAGRWRIILVCFYEKTDQVGGFYRKPFHNLQFGPVYWGYTVHLVTKYSPSAFYVTEVRWARHSFPKFLLYLHSTAFFSLKITNL